MSSANKQSRIQGATAHAGAVNANGGGDAERNVWNARRSRIIRAAGTLAAATLLSMTAAATGDDAVTDADTTPLVGLVDAPLTAGATAALPAPSPTTAPTTLPAPTTAPARPMAPLPPLPAVPAMAAAPATRPAGTVLLDGVGADGKVNMLVGRSVVLKTLVPYKRVSVTQPEVLGDNEIDPNSILLTAKKSGSAQIIVWDEKDRSQVIDVLVDIDLVALDAQIKKMFPGTDIQLSSSAGSIVLRGRVPNLQLAEQVAELVGPYGKVLNFLELAGGQQVMLQVRFAEVSRTATTNLGVNFAYADAHSGGGSNLGPNPFTNLGPGNLGSQAVNPSVTVFGGGQIGSVTLDVFVQALRANNLLRVLAEPNLVAISGQEASFLAGGEFPIPIPQAGGSGGTAITVEYKQFGVRLNFVPVVLGDGKIRLKVSPEVSDLDFTQSVSFNGFTIPSLTKRNVTTTIELNEGQTFAVAGLLNNRVTANKSAVPLLGDLPILGTLFRSVRYERSETELVVLVTPRLVEAMNPKQVPDLPGERWRFPTEGDLFWNQDLGGPALDTAHAPAANKAGPAKFRGPYGFTPATSPSSDVAAGRADPGR